MTYVKVCGLRTEAEVAAAVAAGADAVGLVFADSPRWIDVETGRRLVAAAGSAALTVGVFAGQPIDTVRRIAGQTGVASVQLHGAYPKDAFTELAGSSRHLVRAVPAHAPDLSFGAYGEQLLIVDAPTAGSGRSWDYASTAGLGGQWLLAGGLTADTVRSALRTTGAYGVDVSSGVEVRRGVKSLELIRRFVHAAKQTTG